MRITPKKVASLFPPMMFNVKEGMAREVQSGPEVN
jgi:hypothetical protein